MKTGKTVNRWLGRRYDGGKSPLGTTPDIGEFPLPLAPELGILEPSYGISVASDPGTWSKNVQQDYDNILAGKMK